MEGATRQIGDARWLCLTFTAWPICFWASYSSLSFCSLLLLSVMRALSVQGLRGFGEGSDIDAERLELLERQVVALKKLSRELLSAQEESLRWSAISRGVIHMGRWSHLLYSLLL